ncbi:MAG TPA: response regulator, partial [Isosphaeraceae bacterium]|nr:response regulator [Isosphaeraceae bacterium]
RQSERLESLGQLAGGIAHDFNNLLAVILNYAAFVAEEITDRPAVLTDVQQIQRAAERAVGLTRQLLIFGRRDITEPEVLDLNVLVADVYNLLSRSIGEHIELRVVTGSNVRNIRADRGQIEQVLLNLAVNARDAMPDGGTLTIETGLIELDEIYSQLHPEVTPGHYIELAVSDVGIGMSTEIASQAANCEDALSLAASNDFQLLLTDSVMPHMSGPTLAQHIEELRPGRPVLYMSGYSGGVLSPQRVLDEGLAFLQKPFNRQSLLEKVRATLSAPPAGSSKGQ